MGAVVAQVSHVAPGPYLGFGLQPVRLCYHLLTAPAGSYASLEYIDDVAVHLPNAELIREQTKSAISKQNPLSDWAVDFWKTISHWLTDGGSDVEKTAYRYYVTPIKPAVRTQALSNATTKAEVIAITDAIRTAVARRKKPMGCMPHLQTFLSATDDERAALITRMQIVSTDNDPLEPIRNCFALVGNPALIETLCQVAIGMAKEEAERLLRRHEPAIISADEFREHVGAYVRKVNLPGLLSSFTPEPAAGHVASVLSTRPTFIRQLELVGAEQGMLLRAVSDYLRTSADKSDWAEKGLIFGQSLNEWDGDLIRRHSFISTEINEIASGKSPEARGLLIYGRCAMLQPPLEGRVVPGHFVHGCFNSLADLMRLGWHPDYAQLLEPTK